MASKAAVLPIPPHPFLFMLERVTGFEPVFQAWKAWLALYPLSYTRLERMAGVKPASQPWQGFVLPLNYIRLVERIGIEPMQLRAST